MIKVDVDFSGLDNKLRQIAKITEEEPAKLIVQETRLLCVELAKYTQPFGFDDAAKKQGEAALERDYQTVYRDASKIYEELKLENKNLADGFWKAFQQRKWDRAAQILRDSKSLSRNAPIQPFDGGTAHKQRFTRGRLRGVAASLVLQVQKGLKPFLAKEKGKVGFAKGGWANCAKQLGGTRGIPAWVTRHDTPASVIDNTDAANPSVTIRNEVNYTSQVLSATAARQALRDRETKLTERIRRIMGAKLKSV